MVSLATGIELWRTEEDAPASSYESYRREARAHERITLGGTAVPVVKLKGTWMVHREDLDRALRNHRANLQELQAIDDDYAARRLRLGDVITTSWGGYSVRGDFHFVWSRELIARMKSNGTWVCNGCWKPAGTERDRPECYRCSDWSNCGSDCTLSRIFCDRCGTTLTLWTAARQSRNAGSSREF